MRFAFSGVVVVVPRSQEPAQWHADVGIDAIKAFWLEDDDEVFSMQAEPVAVDGDVAVVRVAVRYGDPVRQEYRDLSVMRFAGDGRVADCEEWPFWPGQPYAAPAEEGRR